MAVSEALEAALRRDRWIVLGGIAAITVLAWAYLVLDAGRMGVMEMGEGQASAMAASADGSPMGPQFAAWTLSEASLVFLMWTIMMIGMMVPSAAPMILLYAGVHRGQSVDAAPFAPTVAFTGGYLTVWTVFSLIATLAQYALERLALLSPMMVSSSTWLGASLLALAGIYQLTPLKGACLEHCRSPLHVVSQHWRPGSRGAWRMGLSHGAYCVGCCWFLMALLFVGGVMNLVWVAAIAVFVLLEKVAPWGRALARISGIGFLLGAVALVAMS